MKKVYWILILLSIYSCVQSQNKEERDSFYNFKKIIEKEKTDIKIGEAIESDSLLHLFNYKKDNYSLKYGYRFNIRNIKCIIYFISYPAQVPIEIHIATFIDDKKIDDKKVDGLNVIENNVLIYEKNEVLFTDKRVHYKYIIDNEGKIKFNKELFILQELFAILPDSAALNLSREERINVLKCLKHDNGDCNRLWVDTIDEKNGYLSITGAFEGSWEMTYWKNNKNQIMVAVNSTGCGPACYNKYTYFYLYKDQKLTYHPFKLPILKVSDFFNEPTLSKVLKYTPNINVVFRLPQKGTTITGELSLTYSEFMNQSRYNTVELQWDGEIGFKTVLTNK